MIIEKYLKKVQEECLLVTIESTSTDDDFSGHVLHFSQEYVCMAIFTNSGRYDGVCIFETESIEEMYWGNREHLAISKLVERNNLALSPQPIVQSSFEEAIIALSEKYEAIEIYVNSNSDNFDVATIIEHDKENLYLKTFGPKKSLSNLEKVMKFDNISFVMADSPYLNDMLHLHLTSKEI